MMSQLVAGPLLPPISLFSQLPGSSSLSPVPTSSTEPPIPFHSQYRKEFNLNDPNLINKFATKLSKHENFVVFIRKVESWEKCQLEVDSRLDKNKFQLSWNIWGHRWTAIITSILIADLKRHDVIREIDQTEDPVMLERYRKKFWKTTAKLQEALDNAKVAIFNDEVWGKYLGERWKALTAFSSSLKLTAFSKGYFIDYETNPPETAWETFLNSGTPAILHLTYNEGSWALNGVKISSSGNRGIKLNKMVYQTASVLKNIISKSKHMLTDDPKSVSWDPSS
jgi:hypothetical protein